MGIIKWTDDLSVNNTKIDDQHRKLIDIYNSLHSRMMDHQVKAGFDVGLDALKEMIKYGKYHFSSEEKFMEKINYPDIENHKKIHNDFIRQLDRIALELHQNGFILNSEIMKVMENWLVDHILNEDQKLKAYNR